MDVDAGVGAAVGIAQPRDLRKKGTWLLGTGD